MAENQQSNINTNYRVNRVGLNLDSSVTQMEQGMLSYALNAICENFDGNSVNYTNEQSNEFCSYLPESYTVIGTKNIIEEGIILVWILNKQTGDSEIGQIVDCIYSKLINSKCLGFDINHPILKIVYRKTNCGLEVYWVDGKAKIRMISLTDLPFRETKTSCETTVTSEIDCNRLSIQPEFSIPDIKIHSVNSDGELTSGDYQFAAQYANALAEPYTSFYSITNPVPIADPNKITADFNYSVGKSISIDITNIDTTGIYDYINIAVIKTINNITSAFLVGTFQITKSEFSYTYTGINRSEIQLDINDIFQKYEIYDTANDLTVAQDVLIPSQLTSSERISYQEIANQITLQWQTYRFRADKFYQDSLNCALYTGCMRDEVYPFEIVPLLKNGKQMDGFTIPGRVAIPSDLEEILNDDVTGITEKCESSVPLPKWRVYNTASVLGNPLTIDECYEGPYQFGEFAYWESTENYPCNAIYGDLGNKPIRHHKFPDNIITPHFDDQGFIYPIGVKIDVQQVVDLINNSSLTQEQKDEIQGFKIVRGNAANNKTVIAKGIVRNVGKYNRDDQTYFYPNYPYNDLRNDPFISTVQTENDTGASNQLAGFTDDDSKKRYVFNSPDTSFFQPSLGTKLKLEQLFTGTAKAHFIPVLKHSQYKFISDGAYFTAIIAGAAIGFASATINVGLFQLGGQIFNGQAAFTAYQVFVDILQQTCPKINYAWQYTSVGSYTAYKNVENQGNKIRHLDIASYIIPGMQAVGDDHTVNNFQRESSVYLRTATTLPFPDTVDESRFINSESNCDRTILERPISLYYSSIKEDFPNQWGQLYSYETIDTGYQKMIALDGQYGVETIFGGDTFINRYAFKTKIPFFLDNRVGFPDEADIDYRDFGNIAYPTYWFSSDTGSGEHHILGVAINIPFLPRKINNFDCDTKPFFYQKGKIYLFAYGIPYFYGESRVNVDLRQAYNGQEGDFYPHVAGDIPDDWVQETNTSIKFDNTYTYNKTFSKQNKENLFTHLPDDFTEENCRRIFPWRAIFSEPRTDSPNPSLRNNWLIFKPAAVFDFPQNYGRLISLDGIEHRQVLARFENKTLLYNALLTAPTSAADVYLGQTLFSQQVPPLDFADTDGGFVGTQHKFFLKTEYGHITADSKRGQVFLLKDRSAQEITNKYVSKFFTQFLDFYIQRKFPTVNIDNHYAGIGLHGVFDPKYNRLILTKLDYECIDMGVLFDSTRNIFSKEGVGEISLKDTKYFCNRSFTISYDFDTNAWISFHTYLPNFYIPEANSFYSGINNGHSSIWQHVVNIQKFNDFYGEIAPYVIESPYSYEYNDEILQNVKDYSRVLQYTDYFEWVETDDYFFNNLILWNSQQTSGVLKLTKRPKASLAQYNTFPKYFTDHKEVTFAKSNSFYNINTFWSVTTDPKKPIWVKSCASLSEPKALNQANCNYGKRSYHKAPLMAKNLFARWILNDRNDIKIISIFNVAPSQISYK